MKEIWKKIEHPYDNFSVSNLGKVRNDITKYIFNNKNILNGYVRVRLTQNKLTRTTMVHILVAESFVPRIKGRDFVDHINRIPSDNRASNLRWVNRKENIANSNVRSTKSRAILQKDIDGNIVRRYNRIKDVEEFGFSRQNVCSVCRGDLLTAGGFIWEYEELFLHGEVFKELILNGQSIFVSNMGRVKLASGKITYGHMSGEYKSISVKGGMFRVNRLVAKAFLGAPKKNEVAHHKDGNKLNNKSENLEWVSKSLNRILSKERKKADGYIVPVVSINDCGDKVIYESVANASRTTGASKGNIVSVCRGVRKSAKGLRWEYHKRPQ